MRKPSGSSSPSSSAAGGSSSTGSKPTPCCSKVGLKRGPWTPEEDELLSNYINREGEGRWRTLPRRAGLLRCGKSCRLRWMNYLRPSVKRGQIAPDEEDLILRLHRLLGNRWSLIAGRIPGRTDNEIKNYWNTHLSKKLISQGIDPRTHKLLNIPDQVSPTPKSMDVISTPSTHDVVIAENETAGRRINDHEDKYGCDFLSSTDHHGGKSWVESPVCLMKSNNIAVLQSSSDDLGNSNDEDGMMDYCCDDVFSSFLNSLMNEEALTLPQQQQSNNLVPPDDQQIVIWEAAGSSVAGANVGDEHLTYQINKSL